MKPKIYQCLEYCQKQNGLPSCKNCSLDEDIIKEYKDYILNILRDDLPAYWGVGIERTYEAGWDDCLTKVIEKIEEL